MIPARILGTGSVLPERVVTTAEIAAAVPGRSAEDLHAKTGIRARRWAERGTRMAPLGAEALRRALDAAGLAASDLRRLVFVSSTGGDWLIPATANSVARALGLTGGCDCFDVNNACTGFLTAFDLGARSVATGLSPVGIVVVELMSHYIQPADPRPYVIFGDAAAAVVLGPGRPGEGVAGVSLGNDGSREDAATVGHPRLTGSLSTLRFSISNRAMSDGSIDLVLGSVKAALAQGGCGLADLAWVLPHQPNGRMFEAILGALDVDPSKTVPVVEELGSIAAASIPVSLDRLMRTRPVRPGDRILMTAIGGGVSYGALLYRVAPEA